MITCYTYATQLGIIEDRGGNEMNETDRPTSLQGFVVIVGLAIFPMAACAIRLIDDLRPTRRLSIGIHRSHKSNRNQGWGTSGR